VYLGTHCNIGSKRAFPTGVLNRWHNCLLIYWHTSCLVPAFDDTYCHAPATEWCQRYLTCYLLSLSNLVCFSSMPEARQLQRHTWFTVPNVRHRTLPKMWEVRSLYTVKSPGERLWMIITVKMESRHPVEGYFGSEFRAICNHDKTVATNLELTNSKQTLPNLSNYTFLLHLSVWRLSQSCT